MLNCFEQNHTFIVTAKHEFNEEISNGINDPWDLTTCSEKKFCQQK